MALSTSLIRLPSFTLAAVTMSDNGTPRPSTSRWRLLPFFPPIRRVRADSFLRQRGLHHRPVDALPSPGDSFHLVVLGQPSFPQRLEKASLFPLEKALVNGAGAAKALLGQRLPLAARAQYIHDGFEYLARGLRRPTGARLAYVDPVRGRGTLRNQRLHALPELIRHHPRFDSLAQGLAPTPRILRLGTTVYLITDKLLASHLSQHIDRLREYRSSLISAAVTGQGGIGAV